MKYVEVRTIEILISMNSGAVISICLSRFKTFPMLKDAVLDSLHNLGISGPTLCNAISARFKKTEKRPSDGIFIRRRRRHQSTYI